MSNRKSIIANANGMIQSSTGQVMVDAAHLDIHYRVAQKEYDNCITNIGIQKGWRVLDAGSGNGVFIPHLIRLVGRRGSVVAYDLAPENVASIEAQKATDKTYSIVDTKSGSVTKLPFADNEFDAVWCANVTQYLTDFELRKALLEFQRVVRPGGLVAVKEFDLTIAQSHPVDMSLTWRLIQALLATGDTQIKRPVQAWQLSKWFRAAGMEVISRKTYLVEWVAPLEQFCKDYFAWDISTNANIALQLDIPVEDKIAWKKIRRNVAKIVNDPDFCYREAFMVTVAQVVPVI